MPIEIIATDLGTTKYIATSPVVSVADILVEDEFEEVPYLYADRLRLTVAPDLDVCEMHYDYGRMSRPREIEKTHFAPLLVAGKFVKVVVPATVDGEQDIVWYGVVKSDEKYAFGSDGTDPEGRQKITAFGVLVLMDEVFVNKTFIDDGAAATIEIETALPFNYDRGGAFPAEGNRAASDIDGAPVFSLQQRSDDLWSASDIVRYLLKRFAPQNAAGDDANEWSIDPEVDVTDMLIWNELSLDAEFRTVKQLLDQIIDRKRGVGYYAYAVPNDDTSLPHKIYLHPFSFAASDILMPSGQTLKVNPNLKSLDFEFAVDVEAKVNDVMTDRFHKVQVFGEFITSTFTYSMDSGAGGMFEADWNNTEEDAFLAGASDDPEYAGWAAIDGKQERMNAVARATDILRNVFSRFRVKSDWNQRVLLWHDDGDGEYLAAPLVGEADAGIDPVYDVSGNPTGEVLWLQGLRFRRLLPLRDRYDYSSNKIDAGTYKDDLTSDDEPEYLPPIVYICTEGDYADSVRDVLGDQIAECPRFEQVEKLNLTAFDSENGRQWACHVHLVGQTPAVDIKAHPPQMLGRAEWDSGTPEATDPSHDPLLANGLDWRAMFITLCIEIPRRVYAEAEIITPVAGEPLSILAITVPGARCDYVVPFTTVAIKYGVPIVTISGGLLRDDRMRISDIARAAAEWYGDDRKTLQLSYKQVRKIFELGWLITDIGPNYADGPTSIKTPITAIDMVFPGGHAAPTTTIETSFASLDFGEGRIHGFRKNTKRGR